MQRILWYEKQIKNRTLERSRISNMKREQEESDVKKLQGGLKKMSPHRPRNTLEKDQKEPMRFGY